MKIIFDHKEKQLCNAIHEDLVRLSRKIAQDTVRVMEENRDVGPDVIYAGLWYMYVRTN